MKSNIFKDSLFNGITIGIGVLVFGLIILYIQPITWGYILGFTIGSIIGSTIGIYYSNK